MNNANRNRNLSRRIKRLQNAVRNNAPHYHLHEVTARCVARNARISPAMGGSCSTQCHEYFFTVIRDLAMSPTSLNTSDRRYIHMYLMWLFRCFMYRLSYYCNRYLAGEPTNIGHMYQIKELIRFIQKYAYLLEHIKGDDPGAYRVMSTYLDTVIEVAAMFDGTHSNHSHCTALRRLSVLTQINKTRRLPPQQRRR